MSTFNIPIGTSNPPSVCDGLPLLPVPAPRAGISGSTSSSRILDRSDTILFTRLYVSAYFSYQMGMCGPAVAFLFDNVAVTTSNPNGTSGQLQLTFNSGQQIQAGGFLGCVVGGGFSIEQQLYLPSSWYSPWKFSWQTAFKVSAGFEIDFVAVFFQLISYLLSKQGGKGILSQDTANTLGKYVGLPSTFSFVGASQNSGVSQQLTAEPSLTLPINVLQYVPGLAQFVKGLEKIKGELSFGPSFNIGMPVTLSIERFDVTGGLNGANTASYGNLQYSGNQVTASGPVPFSTSSQPSRFTTQVTYATGLSLGLSCHFTLSACKVFNFNYNSPTLDMFRLMSLPAPVSSGRGSVSTSVSVPACVLEPEMSVIILKNVNGGIEEVASTPTGEVLRILVQLSDPYAGSTPGAVTLELDPPLPDFPTNDFVKPGETRSAGVTYAFANTQVVTGDVDDPGRKQPPTAIAASQNYLISASIPSLPNQPCSGFQATVPLNVINRVITAGPTDPQYAATGPPWDPNAGLKLKADPSLPPENVPAFATGNFFYSYATGQTPKPALFRVTLYDDKRQPYGSSNVQVQFGVGATVTPAPSATVTLTPGTQGSPTYLTLRWLSKGPYVGYPGRFFLVLDGGALYGSMEYWLEVWNWS